MEKQKNYLLLVLKGCAMGAADVVPGVSGGTIAFITGIYEELIDSIKSIDLQALKLLLSLKFADFWKKINGSFLLGVAGGIAISIFSLAKLMTWLLEHHPIYIWSFFFGLIVASSVLVAKEIKHWHIGTVISLIAGGCIAYVITVMSPAETPNTWWFIILSGAIAICAMILPGISGAFILLLMGKYSYILGAVSSLNIGVMLLFIVGAVAGIISFSHLLSWLLKKHHTATVATLTGFMVGSLNKVWPWKETLETYTDSHGVVRPLVEANVSPHYFQELTQSDPLLVEAIVMCIVGFVLIYGIEFIGKKMQKQQSSCKYTESSDTLWGIPARPAILTRNSKKKISLLNIGASKCPTSGSFQHYYNKRPTFVVLMSRSLTNKISFPFWTRSVKKPGLSVPSIASR